MCRCVGFASEGVVVNDEACLKCAWHLPTGNIRVMKIMGWQVVHYFDKLTKSKKIPNHKKILKLAADHDLELFKAPERRTFATVDSEDDSDVSLTSNSEDE